MWRWDNHSHLFVWDRDFWYGWEIIPDSAVFSLEEDNNDIDPYRWVVKTKIKDVLESKEKQENDWFKKISVKLDWEEVEIEYKLEISCLLDFNSASENAKKNWARLVNMREFNAILSEIWIEEFNREYPWVMYSDKSRTIGWKWKMSYFWINGNCSWWDMMVCIFSDLCEYWIYSQMWKQYWACSLLIKK